jgi:hypothetical protein
MTTALQAPPQLRSPLQLQQLLLTLLAALHLL